MEEKAKCPRGDHETDRFKKDGSPGVCGKCFGEIMSRTRKRRGAAPKTTQDNLGVKVLGDLQTLMAEKISEVRDLHLTMLAVKRVYRLDVTIKMPSLLGDDR